MAEYRINKQIRAQTVVLIDHEGVQHGAISIRDALAKAQEAGLDLVEVHPRDVEPVCKLMNYGKVQYQQQKRERDSKKTHVSDKEVKLSPAIGQGDLDTKLRHAREFLEKGHKVKFTIMLKGRQIGRAEDARKILHNLAADLADVGTPDGGLTRANARQLNVLIAPKKK